MSSPSNILENLNVIEDRESENEDSVDDNDEELFIIGSNCVVLAAPDEDVVVVDEVVDAFETVAK